MHCWIWNLIGYLVHQSTGDWHVWGSGVRRKKREWVSTRSLFGCFRLYGGHISSDLHKWTVNQMATFSNVQGLLHLMWNEILVTDFFFLPFCHHSIIEYFVLGWIWCNVLGAASRVLLSLACSGLRITAFSLKCFIVYLINTCDFYRVIQWIRQRPDPQRFQPI